MFARVAWGKVKPGTWEEYERIYHEEILPETRDVKGLRSGNCCRVPTIRTRASL